MDLQSFQVKNTLTMLRKGVSVPRATTGKWEIRTSRSAISLMTIFVPEKAWLFLDRIKREKGVWWMPWQQEAMKDVILCDKPWGAENRL